MENINDIFRIIELCRSMDIELTIRPEYPDGIRIILSKDNYHLSYSLSKQTVYEVINSDGVDDTPNSAQFMEQFIKAFINGAIKKAGKYGKESNSNIG